MSLISFASVERGICFFSSERGCLPCFRTSRAGHWGKSCSAPWSLAVTRNTVREVPSPSKVRTWNVMIYKVTVNHFKGGIGLSFTILVITHVLVFAQERPTSWRSSTLSIMNWLPVRFCPLGDLQSESPVRSLSSYPVNQDCPLLGPRILP